VLLFLGCARAGLVHVSVNYNARTDELAYLPTRPEPATVFHVTLLAEHVAAALTHPRHPQRGTLAAVEPSTCRDGAATKAARLTRNSTATLTWCSCCIGPARPRAPAFLASEAFSYVTGTGLGELGLTRYRLFHARLGSMSCKPFGDQK
jgi:acyl-CoA synthetase (AMP-forming)/AMP-acid ligase II